MRPRVSRPAAARGRRARWATALLATALAWTVVGAEAAGPAVTIATGTTAGVYNAAGSAICRLLARTPAGQGTRCEVRYSAGSLANVPSLRDRAVDLALVQADVQHFAYRGEGVFAPAGPFADMRHLLTLMPEALTIVTRPDSGIETGADLYGRRVNLGQYGSGTMVLAEMLASLDSRVDTIQAVPDLRSTVTADALCRRRIDAFVFVAAHPNPLVEEAVAGCKAVLVPAVGPTTRRLVEAFPFYSYLQVRGGLYETVPAPVPTIGVRATLVARVDLPDATARAIVEALYGQVAELRRLHLAFADLDAASLAARCNAAPLHPAVAAFMARAGIAAGPC